MKNKIKLALAVTLFAVVTISCNTQKSSEQPDTNGKDSIATDTTNTVVADTVQVPADSTAAKQ